jgi:hypothetical protein
VGLFAVATGAVRAKKHIIVSHRIDELTRRATSDARRLTLDV